LSFVEGSARDQINLLPPCIDDYVASNALARVVDAFVPSLNLAELGFGRAQLRAVLDTIQPICCGSTLRIPG